MEEKKSKSLLAGKSVSEGGILPAPSRSLSPCAKGSTFLCSLFTTCSLVHLACDHQTAPILISSLHNVVFSFLPEMHDLDSFLLSVIYTPLACQRARRRRSEGTLDLFGQSDSALRVQGTPGVRAGGSAPSSAACSSRICAFPTRS